MKIKIKVPATSANLGPGFDALGLALDLWNETEFATADEFSIEIEGEGADRLAPNRKNLILRSAQKAYDLAGQPMPPLCVRCVNRIPTGSGLGSSAAAVLTGLLGANALLGSPLSRQDILGHVTEIEGHPDNVAPALLGGLVVSTMDEGRVITHRLPVKPLAITVVLPDFEFPTRKARAVLPKEVPLKDAAYNLSRAVLAVEALRSGDLDLLGQVMDDRLHQPYRLKLIPGAVKAIEAGKQAGAAAVALSGAGPSLIAFSAEENPNIGNGIQKAFESTGLKARILQLGITEQGALVSRI